MQAEPCADTRLSPVRHPRHDRGMPNLAQRLREKRGGEKQQHMIREEAEDIWPFSQLKGPHKGATCTRSHMHIQRT